MRYERQKMIRKELERIPRGLKGSPQNQVRQIVTSQYQHGKSWTKWRSAENSPRRTPATGECLLISTKRNRCLDWI
jgi:hypothetical protein